MTTHSDVNKDTTTEVAETVNETVDKVQTKAGKLADEAKSQAIEITEEAKTTAKSTLDSRKDMAARELNSVAEAMRQTGQSLSDQDQATFADYSYRMADQIERASSYLEHKDVGELVHDTEDFARRQPELFIGGAFTLGLLAARFLKSSSPSRPRTGANNRTSSNIRRSNTYAGAPYSWRESDELYGTTPGTSYAATQPRES